MITHSYNGWSNKATWLVNTWIGDMLYDMANDGEIVTAEFIKNVTMDMIDDSVDSHGLVHDLITNSLAEVNWKELERHYKVEKMEPELDCYGDNALVDEF